MINHARISQQKCRKPLQTGIAIVFLLLSSLIARPVLAVEKGDYKAPSLDGFTLTSEEDADGDGDAVKETHVRHYSNATGDFMFSMTTKGKLWAWSRQSHAGAESGKNYVVRDSNCDGVFDEQYSLDEEYHVPDCLK
jgi:hypothetical protein